MIVMYWALYNGKGPFMNEEFRSKVYCDVLLNHDGARTLTECCWIIPGTFDELYNDDTVKDNGWMIDYNIVPIVD